MLKRIAVKIKANTVYQAKLNCLLEDPRGWFWLARTCLLCTYRPTSAGLMLLTPQESGAILRIKCKASDESKDKLQIKN